MYNLASVLRFLMAQGVRRIDARFSHPWNQLLGRPRYGGQ